NPAGPRSPSRPATSPPAAKARFLRRRLSLSRRAQRRQQLRDQIVWLSRDLVPRGEHEAEAVPARHTPLLVVVLIVEWIVVPSAAVRLKNRAPRRKREVESIPAALPLQRELAGEAGDAARDEKTARLNFKR